MRAESTLGYPAQEGFRYGRKTALCSAPRKRDEMRFWRAYFDLEKPITPKSRCRFRLHPILEPARSLARASAFSVRIRGKRSSALLSPNATTFRASKKLFQLYAAQYGEKLESGLYAFPGAETLAPLSVDDLAPLRRGLPRGLYSGRRPARL